MEVTETVSDGLRREFKVVVPAADLATKADAKIGQLKSQVRINGFRPGKVPVAHLKRLYGRAVMAEMIEAAVREANVQIVTERGFKLAREPQVTLPEGVEPLTLTASDAGVLVGGRAPAGRVLPRILSLTGDGVATQVPLTPVTGYAFEARWLSIATDGTRIVGVGGAPGGAHSNTRWTTWAGTARGVNETPQVFYAFGGWGAGEQIGAVMTSAGTLLAGSWEGARAGLDAAIWLPEGDTWVRQDPAGTALQSTPELLVGPRSATASGAGVVLPGSAIHLAPGSVRQVAALWRSQRLNEGWSRLDLPDAGSSSEAVSARCGDGTCLVAGRVDGNLALWSVSGPLATRVPGLPEVPVEPTGRVPQPLLVHARQVLVASSVAAAGTGTAIAGTRVALLVRDDSGWTVAPGPPGGAVDAALAGDWLYVVAASPGAPAQLWRCDVRQLA